MSEYRLWAKSHMEPGWGLLIEAKEVDEAVAAWEEAWLIRGIAPEKTEELNAKLREDGPAGRSIYDVEEWLEGLGFEGFEVESADNFVEPEEGVLVYWYMDQWIDHLPDVPTTPIYRWWDGSNWRTEWLQDVDTEHRLVLGECLSLDEWDGRNWQTGGLGKHARVYAVVELDGEAPEEPTYLLERWSQWQGDHPIGRLYTADELSAMLEEVGRDPQEYLPKITALNE